MPDCPSCQSAQSHPPGGRYNINCIACMARLIVNARPSKSMQELQIAYLQRHHKTEWPELWPQIKNQLKLRNNTNAQKTT